MRKFVILVITLVIFTSIFPNHLLVIAQSDEQLLDNVDEVDLEGNNFNTQEEKFEENGELQNEMPNKEPVKPSEEIESDDKEDKNENNKQESEGNEDTVKEKEPTKKKEGDNEGENEPDQYNEFGVKIGTIIYGEDISKLNEEELQYIPEAWREGNFKEEHREEDLNNSASLFANYPDVNNYILSKNLPTAKKEVNHKNFFTKFNYRKGFGKVEGVVAHETANNNSTITQEIAYMSRNHKNAFVHAFVDHSRIIEIHPTDYGAWGAGRFANQRFVHVELTRVKSFDEFARSINNYSDYIASILYKYNLGVTDAEKSGSGTLWSHNAVSKHLGGTTHVDPHGYFARWGYNWNDFVELVTIKYNKLALNEKNTSKIGHIRSAKAKIYEHPSNPHAAKNAGSKYTNAVYYIKKEANYKGDTYYLLSEKPSSKSGVVGWIKAKDADVRPHKGMDSKSKEFKLKGTGNAYTKVWGGSKNKVYSLSSFKGQTFKVNLTESVGNNIWYRGILNGKQVWIHSSYVKANVKESSTSLLGHLKANAKIYKSVSNPTTFTPASNKYTNEVYYIKKEAISNNQKYYLISKSPSSTAGKIGWVKANEMTVYKHTGVDKKTKRLYIKGNGSAYNKAWGGSKNLVYPDLSWDIGEEFTVNLTEKVGNNTWYRGKLKGKTVWIHSSYLTKTPEVTTRNISRLGHIRSSAKVYSNLINFSTKPANEYKNQVYYVKKQAIVKGKTYYLISTKPSSVNGVIGWVEASQLDSRQHQTVDKKSKVLYIKGNGKAYNKVWGGSKNLVYSNLDKYKYKQFKVNLTEKVGNNTWYRGELDGNTIWLHSSYVSTKQESSISRIGHLRHSAKIYPDLHNQDSYKNAKDGYTNAVYYIKKQATFGKDKFYLISTEPSSSRGIIGWVKSEELDSRTHRTVNSDSKTFTIKGTGKAYNKVWGGSKNLVFNSMSSYKGNQFKVNLTEKVGNNIWHRGKLNGKTVWLHSSYLK